MQELEKNLSQFGRDLMMFSLEMQLTKNKE